ncbi:carboxypeptidase-like regulatory domain-containing protein [Flavobacterium piscinae]|uniref:Carboxypeptidase-like regulatory domain-containing protein n=1 Tax=Flavobacterium piscinae TaxID=2506424 RepID=A0A4Q1L0I4_9FLAO|nr:DUF5686 family protein [Flavobacterium piscinae]RXR35389.1 carboxypeptidase-like regulatory domain-containing protein [Flavobacterium piscinae]
MKYLAFLFLFCSFCVQAQFRVTGIIKDEASKKPLPFATIQSSSGRTTIADINGQFEFISSTVGEKMVISYVNFRSKEFTIDKTNHYSVFLQSKTKLSDNEINESQKKAESFLNRVYHSIELNNPKKALSTYQYKGYNKIVVTAHPDSIKGKIDTIKKFRKIKIDSTDFKFQKLIRKQHLFVTEKVSLFQFSNDKFKETVLASQMSGFKSPIYEVIGFNLQSSSVYEPRYELLETKYVNPISKSGLRDYQFELIDTIQISNRPTVLVYFKNKKQINKKGLEGLLFIDQENFAVAKAIMRVRGIIDLTAVHEFEYLSNEKIWFPTVYELKIIKGKNDDPIKILGGTIEFEGEYDELGTKREKSASDYSYLQSKTFYYDREINKPFTIDRNSVAIEIDEDVAKKDTTFWIKNRKERFTKRDRNTFAVKDSLAFFKGINAKLFFGRKIINGYVPLGFFDFDLRYLMSYNNYEGFRFGLGGITNERFSKNYKLDGYLAYGLKDDKLKYHFGGTTRVGNFSNTWAGFSYTDDVQEIGSTKFNIDKRVFKIYDPRPINVSTFYNHRTWKGYVETNFLPKTESIWQLNHSKIQPLFNYAFFDGEALYNRYDMTTASVSIQWNPFSDYMHTPSGKIEIEKRYPKFTFQFTESLPKFLGNDFKFGKIDVRAEYEKQFINGQKSMVLIQAGYAHGDIPLTHLYNNSPNNLDREVLLQRITVAGKNSFETMRFNEFFSSQYIMFHFKHGFKRVKLFNKVKPSLVLVSRMTWGSMKKPEQHVGLNYKTINDGYFESGIELNQIFSGLGLAGFYRYGPNQLSRFEDNIAIKLTFTLDLGL